MTGTGRQVFTKGMVYPYDVMTVMFTFDVVLFYTYGHVTLFYIWYNPKRDLVDEAKLLVQIGLFRARLADNYAVRQKSGPFKTVDEFTHDGGLDTYTQTSTSDFMSEHAISGLFTWADILPLTSIIYDQGLSINAFAGIVSVLPSVTDAYTVQGGNSQIVEAMIAFTGAGQYLNSTVTEIARQQDGYYLTVNGDPQGPYDDVVIATPIEFLNASFVNISMAPITPREFVEWHVTLVSASSLNPSYFGMPAGSTVPDLVVATGNSTAPFAVINPMLKAPSGNTIYKIFSNSDISSLISSIFVGVRASYVHAWPFTFPRLDVVAPGHYQPIVLADGLYYVNTIESLASAMECSTLAGRNIAQIINGT
eukprot:TRINITY_DN16218_c0_g1_i1.p1 TRINITY_DN16218_c0_g1~~TRINITY_DN16218_c0_g1_i1.p1  ORF type:complete len:365 (-),score=58.79 TRINITY_DN16218_c0_g1_i1:116-1210(-)